MHQSVLLKEAIESLNIKQNGIYLDATFGRGGHSHAILERLGPEGKLIAFDKDPESWRCAEKDFANDGRFKFFANSFSQLQTVLAAQDLIGNVNGILFDLGVSSPQLDDASRGFSFLKDGSLDMRMNNTEGQTAAEWLMYAKEAEIAQVLWEFGEEKYSRRIARAIVAARKEAPIQTTAQLAAIVSAANPRWERHKHPATRSFQAIRIFINRELLELEAALTQAVEALGREGRLVVISFHSLEDRIVKRFIRSFSKPKPPLANLPSFQFTESPILKTIGRSVKPSTQEIEENPRSRSAIMRVAEKMI